MWLKESSILLKEAGPDGNGGASTSIEDAFTGADEDDFDLTSLRGKSNDDDQSGKSEIKNQNPEDGKDENGNLINIPDEDDEIKSNESDEKKEEVKETDDQKAEKEKAKKLEEEKNELRQKEIDDISETLKKEGKSEDDINKAIEEKQQQFIDEDIDSEINPFNEFEPSEKSSGENVETTSVNYNDLAKDLEIELEEGVEIKSKEDLKDIYKKHIEKVKSTVDLSQFSPEARMVIENIQKNKNLQLTDFYRNDTIRSIDNFLSLPDDRKVKSVLAEEGKKSGYMGEELKDFVEDKYAEMTDEDISSQLKEINRNATAIKTKEFSKVIAEKNKYFEEQSKKEQEKVLEERQNLVKKIKETKTYNGFKIPENVINIMAKEIESGEFQNILDENVEEAKINAYIGIKLGKQLEAAYQKMLKKVQGDNYQKGIDTLKKMKHNIKSSQSGVSTGSRKANDLSFSSSLFEED